MDPKPFIALAYGVCAASLCAYTVWMALARLRLRALATALNITEEKTRG